MLFTLWIVVVRQEDRLAHNWWSTVVLSLPIFQAQPNTCINQEVKGTRNFRQWQEYHCSCDLSDHRKDFILESFLSLFSECTIISGSLVTISNYHLSRTLSICERTATTFLTELLYNPTFSCPTLFRYFMSSEWVVRVKVNPHFCTRVKFSSGYRPRWYNMLLMSRTQPWCQCSCRVVPHSRETCRTIARSTDGRAHSQGDGRAYGSSPSSKSSDLFSKHKLF